MSFAFYDENIYLYNEGSTVLEHNSLVECSVGNGDIIPPATVLRQLSIAIEYSKSYKSIKDMITQIGSSPARRRESSGFSKLKLFTSQARGKNTSDIQDDQILSFFQSTLNYEGLTPSRTIGCFLETRSTSMLLSRDIHGAPPESLVAKLAEIMGSLKSLQKMALFWCKVVAQLRKLWVEDEYVPGIPEDEIPDLNCCLIYQQLQVINCCISRKKRHQINTELLESLESKARPDVPRDDMPTNPAFYARLNTGELVLRLGAASPANNLSMLETGEPVYTPQTQEGPLLTEDLIREHEELVLRTGSLGAGCSQLLSDMQAFKAANPGCILEDFVRWHSPPDWTESGSSDEGDYISKVETPRGRLSSRMQKEGNLWLELWETSKPVPAVRQAPLFDEDLAVESILTGFQEISPSNLFGQLFLTLLGVGFVLAEDNLSIDNHDVSRLFSECKDYVVAICEGDCWCEKIGDLCQVYDSVEAMVLRPHEYMSMMKQREECGTPRSPFKRLSFLFRGKSKSPRMLTPRAYRN